MKINKLFRKNYKRVRAKEMKSSYDPFGSYTGVVAGMGDAKPEQDADDL